MKKEDRILVLRTLLVVFVAVATVVGCRPSIAVGDMLLARVGDHTLYLSEVRDIFTDGLTPDDITKLLDSYIDMWVRSELKVGEAERRFRNDEDDIEAKVQLYRKSLLTYKLDQYYIDKYLDTTITDEEMSDYYNANMAGLKLDAPIVKGLIVRLNESFRGRDKLKSAIAAATPESRRDFIDISLKNGFDIREWKTWVNAADFIPLIDVPQKIAPEKLFSTHSVQEFSAGRGGALYSVQIYDSRMAGEIMPQELPRTRSIIRTILLNGRRREVLHSCEDTLMMQARAQKRVMINTGEQK